MSTSISSALTLMAIGMITVFVVLLLVYITGNLLIKVINRWFPASEQVQRSTSSTSTHPTPTEIAVITATVEVVTFGQGNIRKIEIDKH
ncbi:MAG: oxaloacetate decarboxylase gamma subunit [Cyclobacteriaceae bacterium]|jgi:oxaloacetate decarboxylase gamma subunit